ncbi:hypothetical protein AK812_SmicGene17833 [Symbiodinium microadriaticum]|uniref:Uncharacterized protein n=1 Tax=Symbiodinium microadriaticum TaxID=2951 RepID=A0A1Q9DWT6_SYMMI|nr:hypothetical protein AK812_SmicGene17833 [Symbiodinium microadriaticum]
MAVDALGGPEMWKKRSELPEFLLLKFSLLLLQLLLMPPPPPPPHADDACCRYLLRMVDLVVAVFVVGLPVAVVVVVFNAVTGTSFDKQAVDPLPHHSPQGNWELLPAECPQTYSRRLLLRAGAGQPATVPLGDLGQIQDLLHGSAEAEDVTVTTKELTLTFSKTSGTGSFADASSGKVILSEAAHSFKAVTDLGILAPPRKDELDVPCKLQTQGHASYEIRQSWSGPAEEGLYGGGSFQNGLINYKHVGEFQERAARKSVQNDNASLTYMAVGPYANIPEVMFQPTTSGDHFFHMGRLMDDSSKPMWGGYSGYCYCYGYQCSDY